MVLDRRIPGCCLIFLQLNHYGVQIRHSLLILLLYFHSRDYSLGSELDLKLGNGWSLTNNIKATHKEVEQSLTIMANPTALDNFFTYALMGVVDKGIFSYRDRNSKTELASVSAVFDPFVQGPPFRYTVLSNNLPANSVMQNGVLFNFSQL